MSFTYKSEDGVAELTKIVVVKDFKTLERGCPRQGSTCSFKILCISNFSTGQSRDQQGILLSVSGYCSSLTTTGPILEPTTVTATIGITSCSEFDRLLDVCLTRLHVGESAEVEIKCHRSKSSSTLTLELVSIEDSPKLYDLTPDQVFEIASTLKDHGVKLFTDGFILDAFYKFSQAIKYFCLLNTSAREAHQVTLISTLQNNMTSCHVKVSNWNDAIDLCNSVLEVDPTNVKALYRRGWSYIEIQEYEKANVDLQKAKELDPENKAVKVKLSVLGEKEKALNAKYAQAMKKFFA